MGEKRGKGGEKTGNCRGVQSLPHHPFVFSTLPSRSTSLKHICVATSTAKAHILPPTASPISCSYGWSACNFYPVHKNTFSPWQRSALAGLMVKTYLEIWQYVWRCSAAITTSWRHVNCNRISRSAVDGMIAVEMWNRRKRTEAGDLDLGACRFYGAGCSFPSVCFATKFDLRAHLNGAKGLLPVRICMVIYSSY